MRMLRLAIDTHIITSHFALPLLLENEGGLVVEMTDGTADYNAVNYRATFFYDLVKSLGAAHGLRPVQGAGTAGRHRRRPDPGLAAVGDDAGTLRRHRGDLARRPHGAAPLRDLRVAQPTSAGPSRRSCATPTGRSGTGSRSPAAGSPRSTASPTSTAAAPTPGATWSRSRTRETGRHYGLPVRDRQLTAIAEIAGMGFDVRLRGGWAMDFTLGEVTRDHIDIDWFAWADDADRLEEASDRARVRPAAGAAPRSAARSGQRWRGGQLRPAGPRPDRGRRPLPR